ncbi:MAG: hypothetical protein JWO38_6612 [Gemmataceae bacterium]|nr:hypothetical protein [Gemmataceae bacterium]
MDTQKKVRRPTIVLAVMVVTVVAIGFGIVAWVRSRQGPNNAESNGTNQPAFSKPSGEFADLPVVGEQRGSIRKDQGGTVEMPDGVRLTVPGGALPADTDITLRRIQLPMHGTAPIAMIDVDAGGVKLSSPATLTIPCPRGKKGAAPPSGYKIYHIHGKKLTELPCRYDAGRQTVSCDASEFSPVILVALGIFVGSLEFTFGPGLSLTGPEEFLASLPAKLCDPPLPVPYYAQGDASWCWAAGAQMLMMSHREKRDVEIWDLAFDKEAPTTRGLRPVEQALGVLPDMFIQRNIPVEYDILPWKSHWVTAGYIAAQLSKGQPVWLGIYGQSHVLVAVGYNRRGIFVHDPSGAIIRDELGSSGVVSHLLDWPQFYDVLNAHSPNWVHTMTVPLPMRDAVSPVGIALMPDQLQFQHPAQPWKPKATPYIQFAWDGQAKPGYKFVPGGSSETQMLYPTNSDKYTLSVNVSNGPRDGGAPLVAVTAAIDDKPLGEMENGIGPQTDNLKFDLTPPAFVKSLPVAFTPGPHTLRIEAKVGGALVDEIEVNLTIAPSQVTGLRLEAKEKETWLAWDAVPEGGCDYDVYFVWPTEGAGVKQATTGQPRWRVESGLLDLKESKWLYVVARHAPSGLAGVPSAFLPLTPSLPDKTILLGQLESDMGVKATSVVPDRTVDRKIWSGWRDTPIGALIKIDNEEMELTGGGDVRRFVDRGVNGTGIASHAKGAKIYLIKEKK